MNSEKKDYFKSVPVEMMRSEIHPAEYNPRELSEDGKRALKRSIKAFGVVGGIVVNKKTGNTIVGGHQRVKVLDELYKYNEETGENDYRVRVEMVEFDPKNEMELNIALNNHNIGGEWDRDKLAEIIPMIDYKVAGFTDEDLNLIGVDYLLQTEEENDLSNELDDLMMPVSQKKEAEKEARKASKEEKIAHMKEVRKQVSESASQTAKDMDAYLMLSFDTYKAKSAFCQRFGYDPSSKFIKGEVFSDQIERVD